MITWTECFSGWRELSMKDFLPADSAERKRHPITAGVLDYFPRAIAEVAKVSFVGNEKHNPGQPLHWARDKSTDHADCIGRHLIDRGKISADGLRHSAQLAWRALALLELELEADEAAAKAAFQEYLDDAADATVDYLNDRSPVLESDNEVPTEEV